MSLRHRLYEILEVARPGDRASRLTDLFILSLILLNVAALVLETVGSIQQEWQRWFTWFEYVSVAMFTVEYLLRLWCCVEHPRFERAVFGRLRFMRTPMALIDLLAVVPSYLPILGLDFRFMRMFRVARVFRALKLVRYAAALRLFAVVLLKKRAELLVTMFLVMVLLLIASSLMYFVEHDTNAKFGSIPEAMWWGIITLTTVGYGDIHPETVLGKMLGAVIAILGIGMVALPTGILGAAFVEEMASKNRRALEEARGPTACPHCGKTLQ